ncbi:type II-A CRISPR-associated protein Csn2 [Weissella paramesenteroides]|uniref:type II-A CRISPR-associated protein Csn2 n=1 Tax=Weissella paramesenteroides TaxID=1249 RepID=UPI003F272927
MKKLTIYPYSPFDIDSGMTIFESKNSTFIWQLSRFLSGEDINIAILSENNKILKVSKETRYIGDVTTVPDFNKIFGKQIAEILVKHCDNDLIQKIQVTDFSLKNSILQVIFDNDLPLEIAESFDVLKLLKYLELSIENIKCESVYDIIEYVIDIANRLADNSLYVFINARYYLSDEQIISLGNEAKIKNVSILLVSLTLSSVIHEITTDDVVTYFIDGDFVDFRSDGQK